MARGVLRGPRRGSSRDAAHAQGGYFDDALFANGVGNVLDGGQEADYVAMDGAGGTLLGGDHIGKADTCTDLSGANSFSSSCDGNCFAADGIAVACGD